MLLVAGHEHFTVLIIGSVLQVSARISVPDRPVLTYAKQIWSDGKDRDEEQSLQTICLFPLPVPIAKSVHAKPHAIPLPECPLNLFPALPVLSCSIIPAISFAKTPGVWARTRAKNRSVSLRKNFTNLPREFVFPSVYTIAAPVTSF